MMNRAGIGSLVRAGPAPGRAGLSHLARGEAVIPNAAMNADPSLRQRAMMAMASRGRNPSQFTVGQQNLRNPSTGMPMYADLIYTDQGWVDASTGQAANFSGSGGFADTGFVAPAPGTPKQYGGSVPSFNDTMIGGLSPTDPNNKLVQMPQILANVTMPDYSGGDAPRIDGPRPEAPYRPPANTTLIGPKPEFTSPTPDPGFAPLMEGYAPPPEQQANFASFSAPQTYDQWAQTRNPSGKNMPNTLFGQTQTGGQDAGFNTGGGMQMPNVLAGQMPVPGASWGTPGTALGFGRENTANDPSILRSGYNDLSLSPSIYSGAFGAGMGQQSGIAFSGQNPMSPNQPNQQQQYGSNFGFNSAFRY